LLLGFAPLQVVPAILLSELVTGIFAAFMHHKKGNVLFDWKKDKNNSGKIYTPTSLESKTALVLASLSIIGTIAAVIIAVNISSFYLKLYIGLLVLAMGILILIRHKKQTEFSWKKITALGLIASFNKGLSGGGYGPVVTSGQILSGIKAKAAIAVTSLSEGLTCLVGIIAYLVLNSNIDWVLAPFLVIGGVLSVPLSAYTVKKMKTKSLTLVIGIITIILGSLTLVKLFL
jgi:uncharacterized membrane protein YfcA